MTTMQDQSGKFNAFTGVFVPNVTMMFGVLLYMRLGYVLGYLGLGQFLLMIGISLALMLVTASSIASVVTNMNVGSGGVYYLISRSLGIEIGGAIGFTLIAAQVISLCLVVSGFAESLLTLYPDISLAKIEISVLVGLLLLTVVSADIALKTQTLIFVILMVSLASIFTMDSVSAPLGSFLPPTKGLSFWGGFAMFYPALTGIEAGMALSGNLKNPGRALSLGTISSLLWAAATYVIVACFLWYTFPSSLLKADMHLLLNYSKIEPLMYLGVWCATLSSALGNMLGSPRMLQMMAEDGIFPSIFSRVYGKHREPRFAVGFIFFSAIFVLFFTTVNQILPILTMICLLTYGILNLVAGISELIHTASWRPAFRTPWQVSLLGAALALFLMLMTDLTWTFISIAFVISLYLYLKSRTVRTFLGDIRSSILFFFSKLALYRISNGESSAAHWLPQVLVITRSPYQNEEMLHLVHGMTRRSGIMSVASIVPQIWDDSNQLESFKQKMRDWFQELKIESFIEVLSYDSFHEGVQNLIKLYGIGPLQPNTILLPFSSDSSADLSDTLQVVQAAQSHQKNLIIYFDASEESEEKKQKVIDLWWDSEQRETFTLMLSYILALRTSRRWGSRTVCLRAVVSDRKAKKHLKGHFESLFQRIRMKIKAIISIEPEGELYRHVKKYSKKADLVFYPLKQVKDFEKEEEYCLYLQTLREQLQLKTPLLAMSCYDALDHREIYYD